MRATAELDLTDFGDANTFLSLLNEHGLRYDGIQRDVFTATHSWVSVEDEEIRLTTQCNPVNGKHADPAGYCRDFGYASYVMITGEMTLARSLLIDVLREAEYVKGVNQQLTTEDGDVVLVNKD